MDEVRLAGERLLERLTAIDTASLDELAGITERNVSIGLDVEGDWDAVNAIESAYRNLLFAELNKRKVLRDV